jgi:hypothetical protein
MAPIAISGLNGNSMPMLDTPVTFPRVEVLAQMGDELIALGVPATMVEAGTSAFTIETSFPFSVGAIHELRLTRLYGPIVRVRVRILSSRRASGPHGALRYSTNMEFVDALSEDGHSPAFKMIYDLQAALSFEDL